MKNKTLFLLDMDGTIYKGNDIFPQTIPFLDRITASGGRYIFMTNNSSKSTEAYIEKLAGMGIRAGQDDFMTSVNATIYYLKKHYSGKKVYVLGTQSLKKAVGCAGFEIAKGADDDADLLLMGFDTELTFQKLDDASRLLTRGVDYVATHPDAVCPTEYGYVPDCGSVADMLYNATGRKPYVVGKPKPLIVELALARAGARREEALIVGDRLNTDIACGIAAGVETALVLSGEATRKDAENSDFKPDYIFESVGEIAEIL